MTTNFRLLRAVLRPAAPRVPPADTAPDDILARFDALLGVDAAADRARALSLRADADLMRSAQQRRQSRRCDA